MEIYYIDKTKDCDKYCFNGSIIIEDNNCISNNVKSLKEKTIINVYRSTENLSESKIMIKKISRWGNSLTQGNIIFDIGRNTWREDPRIFVNNNKFLLSYTFVRKKKNCISSVKIKYCSLKVLGINFQSNNYNSRFKLRPREIHLKYGNNEKHLIDKSVYWEKNWLFFSHYNDLIVVYSLNPLIIYNVGDNKCIKNYIWTHRLNSKWKNFEIRGGASPILVGNNYYFFAHTHDNLMLGKYSLIVIVLDIKLNLVSYTDPINLFVEKMIIYPSGAVFIQDEQKFCVCCGIDDTDQILLYLSYDRLETLLHKI